MHGTIQYKKKPCHIERCQIGINQFESTVEEISVDIEHLNENYQTLFTNGGKKPKDWTSEQAEYNRNIRQKMTSLHEKCVEGIEQLKETKKIGAVFVGN